MLLADEYIFYYGNVGRAEVLCSIVYRVGPKNVSPETFAERADRFNTNLKEICSDYSHLLFWNDGRLQQYTVQDKTRQKVMKPPTTPPANKRVCSIFVLFMLILQNAVPYFHQIAECS